MMVEIESIKIRMIDHTQQMTDKMNTLSMKIGSEQTELSEKIESDQAGMKDSHTRLVFNFNELQGKVNEMGIKCNSMNDTIVSNLEAMNEVGKRLQLNIDQSNREKSDENTLIRKDFQERTEMESQMLQDMNKTIESIHKVLRV